MCTKPRLIVPQVIYHVTSRGVSGVDIFPTSELKTFFLNELAKSLEKFSFHCYGWSVMDDHYHLVLKSSIVPISKFMQRLNSVYAKKFNKESARQGVVFFRRFSSLIVQEENCLDSVVRYVHLNPVRRNACTLEELDDYQWSGHSTLVDKRTNDFQNKNEFLSCFSGLSPIKTYRDFIRSESLECGKDEIVPKIRNANQGRQNFSKPELWVIGDPGFTCAVIEQNQCRRARLARHVSDNITPEALHLKVSAHMGLEKEELFRQGRQNLRSSSRELFAFAGTTRFEFTCTRLAHYLGVTGSAVSRMASRGRMLLEKDSSANSIIG